MKEIRIVLLPRKNARVEECKPAAVKQFQDDLRDWERRHPETVLPKNERTGDYEALSLSVRELDRRFYRNDGGGSISLYLLLAPELF